MNNFVSLESFITCIMNQHSPFKVTPCIAVGESKLNFHHEPVWNPVLAQVVWLPSIAKSAEKWLNVEL